MDRQVKHDFKIVKTCWTSYFDRDYLASKGIRQVWIYYLIDVSLHVYICSLTPSLEAWPMLCEVEFDSSEAFERDEGETEREIMASEEAPSYFGVEVARNPSQPLDRYLEIPPYREASETEWDESDSDYRQRVADQAREYFAGNPCSF